MSEPTYDELMSRGRQAGGIRAKLSKMAPGEVACGDDWSGAKSLESKRTTIYSEAMNIGMHGEFTTRIVDGKLYVIRRSSEDTEA